jgi:3-oxoacyl-[acyl-carrier protein] reductase
MKAPVVLVTGGTGALGSKIVQAMKRNDFNVNAKYRRDSARAGELQSATGCELRRADVGDEAQVEAMFETLPSLFAIIHAAGVTDDASIMRQTRTAWHETLRVNADGAFLVTRAALKKLDEGGRLIILASRVGEQGNSGQAAYAASKAASIALAKCAAREGAARRLAVNVLCPGFVPSALSVSLPPARLKALEGEGVLPASDGASQVAAAVLWLLSDAAAAISGQVIHCDSRINS